MSMKSLRILTVVFFVALGGVAVSLAGGIASGVSAYRAKSAPPAIPLPATAPQR